MSSKTPLTKVSEWTNWKREFIYLTRSLRLWSKIDPDAVDPEPFLEAPIRPVARTFWRPENHRVARTRAATATAAAAAAQQDQPAAGAASVPLEESVVSEPARTITIADLSKDEAARLKIAQNDYKEEKKEYDEEAKRVEELEKWMFSTVSAPYKASAMHPTQNSRTWFANLQKELTQGRAEESIWANMKYRQAVARLQRAPRNWQEWLDEWEAAMSHAIEHDLYVTKRAEYWATDFLETIQPFFPTFVTSYHIAHDETIYNNTFPSFRSLSNSFRQTVTTKEKADATRSRTQKGAFAAAAAAETLDDKAGGNKKGTKKGNSDRTKEIGGRKRKRGDTGNEGCLACDKKYHTWENCWHVFPDQLPDGYTLNATLAKTVKDRLTKEPLLSLVRTVKRAKPTEDGIDDQGD